jgi:hypothetical protein
MKKRKRKQNPSEKNTQTVVLPLWWEKIVSKLADKVCQEQGIKKSSSKYKEKFEKAKYAFSYEGVTNSLMPHGRIGQNPGTPQVSGDTFKFIPDLFDESAVVYKDLTPNRRIDVIRRLRGISVQLANTYLEYAFGLDRKSDFDFKKNMSDETKKKIYIHRFYRLYVVLQVIKALSPVMLKAKNTFLNETNELGISEKMDLTEAASQLTRRNFIEQVIKGLPSPQQLSLTL